MKAIEHVKEQKNLPDFLKDFHDQKDFFKAMWSWSGELIEEKTNLTWINAHIFTIDYFLWYMGLHGYKLQKDRHKDIDFYDIHDTIKACNDKRRDNFASIFKVEQEKNK